MRKLLVGLLCFFGTLTLLISFFPQNHHKDIILDGYTSTFSYSEGDSFALFINSKITTEDYHLKIYNLKNQVVDSLICNVFPQKKPPFLAYEKGFGYLPSAQGKMSNLKSGIYLFGNKIPFLVKAIEPAEVVILYSSNTENAYSSAGGKSLYSYDTIAKKHQPVVSFLRPIPLANKSKEFLKWISSTNQYNISYISDRDLDNFKSIDGAKLIVIVGHSEYWTRKARRNFDRFVEQGGNALILSGNTMWWQVRYNDEKNQLICYKNASYDSVPDSLKTINWTDSILDFPTMQSIGVDFNHGGYGLKNDKGWNGFKITANNPCLFRGTDIKKGDVIHLPTAEYDGTSLSFSNDSTSVKIKQENEAYDVQLIGYDLASRQNYSVGTWIAFQPSESSGIIINTSSTDWCAEAGMLGEDATIVKQITLNMMNLLLSGSPETVFRHD